mgnify:FL=1
MGISTSTGTLIAGQSRTFNLSPASAVTLTLSPNARITITETPATVAATGLGGNASRVHEPRLPGVVTYGPYPMGGSVLVENESNSGSTVTWVRSDSIIAESADGVQSLVDGAGNLVFGDKLVQLFGDDEMIIGTFANRPIATTVAVGKEFMATDLGNARWVSDGTQWILLKPSMLVGEPTQASITDTVGQATTESTLLTLNIPANALGSRDGLLLDLIWSCTNTAKEGPYCCPRYCSTFCTSNTACQSTC